MLDQDTRRNYSPDLPRDNNWYNWLFSRHEANHLRPPKANDEDMKLIEGGHAAMGTSSQYCLRWNNHRNNLLAAFDQLLHIEAFTDVTLACEDGVTLHAHRLVLAACSTYFQALFVNAHTAHHPIVVLKDVRASDMRALLEYMYRGEVNIEHDALQDLLRVAESLKVKGLVEELGTDTAATRRPPSPREPAHPPTSTPLDVRTHQDLTSRHRPSPPTPVSGPPSLPSSTHDHIRSSSPTPPLYTFPPHALLHRPLHRPTPRPDLRDLRPELRDPRPDLRDLRPDLRDHRDPRDHRDLRELDLRSEGRELRDLREQLRESHRPESLRDPHEPRDTHTPGSLDSDPPRPPLSLISPVPHLGPPCPDSPPHKRKRPPMIPEPMLSPTPILRTALGHTHAFPGADMSSLVSLASSMMPLPGLLSSHVPHLLPQDHRDHLERLESPYGLTLKKEQDEESRSFSDISREEEEKPKLDSVCPPIYPLMSPRCLSLGNNGPLLPDFNPYHLDPNGPSHYSNFVSYVPAPKPEWKRYKQYTKADLMEAIEAVRTGMTALQASRKYKVPSRTLYDKIKKMGISTLPRRLPSKKPTSTTDLDSTTPNDPQPTPESHDAPRDVPREGPRDLPRDLPPPLDLDKLPTKSFSGDDDDNSSSAPVVVEDDDESSPSTTGARGSFSLVGRKMFENGGGESSKPLDLTDTDSLLPKRPEIEERA